MQVVHSRTFGTAAKEGGTAVHMLLPLVDFLNHGGDETECFPGDPFAPTANVRWNVPFCCSSCLCLLLLSSLHFILPLITLSHGEMTIIVLCWDSFGPTVNVACVCSGSFSSLRLLLLADVLLPSMTMSASINLHF